MDRNHWGRGKGPRDRPAKTVRRGVGNMQGSLRGWLSQHTLAPPSGSQRGSGHPRSVPDWTPGLQGTE